MASLKATLSTAAVDSIKEPLDSPLSADSSLVRFWFPAFLQQTHLTNGHVSELTPGSWGRCKPGDELLPLPWLSDSGVLDDPISPDGGKDDAFSGMDWMAEDIDLSELDLDSLMGSCDSDEPPSSPEELIASLESRMDLALDPLEFTTTTTTPASPLEELAIPLPPLSPPPLPESQQELEIKSEPASPVPSPSPVLPLSPAYALELGSEVDVPESERAAPKIVLSLSPSHIVLLLAPKEEPLAVVSPGPTPLSVEDDHSDSDSGIGSDSGSCPTPPPPSAASQVRSSRPKPYSIVHKSEPMAGKVKAPSGTPVVVEKKLKKMEQNKTAANRYRQKKRLEQDSLNSECSQLEQRNQELAEKADSISKEIQYLKDLIEEVRNARNRRKGRPEQP
ncbi:hypothetical protein AGOR_G00198330 [Albula goreensis]|uniref:Cyclic AMP-dependent transcription factor ATF-4 n=1 Tax=Albula goreensis TaxID=1534307 RepID=A0A8T3CTU6_9TELE|nr:hypothetical protein AGOR_G00198330 [Albula goreensis]